MTAEANAKALALVADAIRAPGGESAVKMQLAEQYLVELGRILEHADVSVVPAQIAQVKAFFEGMTKVQGAMGADQPATPPTQRRG